MDVVENEQECDKGKVIRGDSHHKNVTIKLVVAFNFDMNEYINMHNAVNYLQLVAHLVICDLIITYCDIHICSASPNHPR